MQPLDQQGEELLEAQAQALHLVRPPAGGVVLHPAQALDQSAVDVWNDGSEPSGGEADKAEQFYCIIQRLHEAL